MAKAFFDVPIKNKEKTSEAILEMNKIMITQPVNYWIMNTFQIATN